MYEVTLHHEGPDHLVMSQTVYPREPMVVDGVEALGAGYRIVWFLTNGMPFDIGRFYRPDGVWTGYYVDITEPIHWRGANASTIAPVVDLFLDVWISPDGIVTILDEDEFNEALDRGYISEAQARGAREALASVLHQFERGRFPPPIALQWADDALGDATGPA